MTIKRSLVLGTVLCTICWARPAPVEAAGRARDGKIDGVRVDIHGNLGYYSAIGAGFRIDIPLVPDGWLRSSKVEDEFALSPGLDLMFLRFGHDNDICHNHGAGRHCHGRDAVGVWPTVVAQWNLYFVQSDWSIFPELGLALLIGDDYYHRDPHSDVYATVAVGFGARWHFSDRGALLMRISHPAGFQFGVTF